MDSPSIIASFSNALETRVCGCEACKRSYRSCSPDKRAKWKHIGNSCNTDGDIVRWMCGACVGYYCSKPTTHRRCASDIVLFWDLLTDYSLQIRRFISIEMMQITLSRMSLQCREVEVSLNKIALRMMLICICRLSYDHPSCQSSCPSGCPSFFAGSIYDRQS